MAGLSLTCSMEILNQLLTGGARQVKININCRTIKNGAVTVACFVLVHRANARPQLNLPDGDVKKQ